MPIGELRARGAQCCLWLAIKKKLANDESVKEASHLGALVTMGDGGSLFYASRECLRRFCREAQDDWENAHQRAVPVAGFIPAAGLLSGGSAGDPHQRVGCGHTNVKDFIGGSPKPLVHPLDEAPPHVLSIEFRAYQTVHGAEDERAVVRPSAWRLMMRAIASSPRLHSSHRPEAS